MGIGRILVGLAIWLSAFAAYAGTSRIEAQAVTLLGYAEDGGVKIRYEMPCGGEWAGLIVREDKDAATLRIAAAVRQPKILCAALPSPKTRVIPYLNETGYRKMAPMSVTASRKRLREQSIGDLRTVGGEDPRLQVVGTLGCGERFGFLVREAGGRALALSLLEHTSPGATSRSCAPRMVRETAGVIDLDDGFEVRPRPPEVEDLERTYDLRLTRVRELRRGERGVSVAYRRRCNEAPVGIVVGNPKRTAAGEKIAPVGVLVARYTNRRCLPGVDKTWQWNRLTNDELHIPGGWQVHSIRPSRRPGSLRIRPASDIAKPRKKRFADELVVRHFDRCDSSVGAVYSKDGRGRLAVAVVSRRRAGACRKPAREASSFQPYLRGAVEPDDLYPLRLQGTALF